MKYYLDTEFDGLGGPLISLALVREDAKSVYYVFGETASDPWVAENVLPILDSADVPVRYWNPKDAAMHLARFLDGDPEPLIIADWPDDIKYFCQFIITGSLYWDLEGSPMFALPSLTFKAERVDAYPTTLPGAIQHNAWWGAMALRHLLEAGGSA